MANPPFSRLERQRQIEYFDRTWPQRELLRGIPFRFADRSTNLAPTIRDVAEAYFRRSGPDDAITWHVHSNHALSSQVCCVNFLMPLATQPERLSRVIGKALGILPPQMLPIEDGPAGEPWYVGFEWTGRSDYLGEARNGRITRGSNATSADAVVRFRAGNQSELWLIEWKYTESYGAPVPDNAGSSRAIRDARYAKRMFAPHGPLRPVQLGLANFLYEPFYQLLRQQMLAFQMEQCGEAVRVGVLHISPRGNTRLHAVTSPTLRPFGSDAFRVFRGLLMYPDRFVQCITDEVFEAELRVAPTDDPWASYLRERYPSIALRDSSAAASHQPGLPPP